MHDDNTITPDIESVLGRKIVNGKVNVYSTCTCCVAEIRFLKAYLTVQEKGKSSQSDIEQER